MSLVDHLANLNYISPADAERDPAPLTFERRKPSRSTTELLEMIERQMAVVRLWQAAMKEAEKNHASL